MAMDSGKPIDLFCWNGDIRFAYLERLNKTAVRATTAISQKWTKRVRLLTAFVGMSVALGVAYTGWEQEQFA